MKRTNVSKAIEIDTNAFLDTGWRCAICFDYAQVKMIDVILCVKHAKRYKFGYGDTLTKMMEDL